MARAASAPDVRASSTCLALNVPAFQSQRLHAADVARWPHRRNSGSDTSSPRNASTALRRLDASRLRPSVTTVTRPSRNRSQARAPSGGRGRSRHLANVRLDAHRAQREVRRHMTPSRRPGRSRARVGRRAGSSVFAAFSRWWGLGSRVGGILRLTAEALHSAALNIVERRSASLGQQAESLSNAPAWRCASAAARARSARLAGSAVNSTERCRNAPPPPARREHWAAAAATSSSGATDSSPRAAAARCHTRRSGSVWASVAIGENRVGARDPRGSRRCRRRTERTDERKRTPEPTTSRS